VLPCVGDESFGLCLAEGMACGLPAIASDIGGIPEIFGPESERMQHPCGILVPPQEHTALVEAMYRLATDRQLRESLGQQARQRIVTHFRWSVAARKLIDVLAL